MQEIWIRAFCFIGIIILGYVLRRIGVFQAKDFNVLSKIVLKITLPAAIVTNFAGAVIDPSLLAIVLLGLGGGIIYMLWGLLTNREREQKKFEIVNLSGYNIGCFTMPFAQSFLGPIGVIATSLFDVGNAFVCLGGSYGIAASIGEKGGFSFKRILKALGSSVAFICYLVMITLNLLHISLPSPILSLAEIIGSANAFVAMLMIGVGFQLSAEPGKIGKVIKILGVRYGVSLILALLCYFFLPFGLEVRQALMVLFFSPMASANPAYTAELDGDVGAASALNSLSILISIVSIVIIMVLVL